MDIDIRSESITSSSTASILSIVADNSPPRPIEYDCSPMSHINFQNESVVTLFSISLQKTRDFTEVKFQKPEEITRKKCDCHIF